MHEPRDESKAEPPLTAPLPYAASLARDRVSVERGPNYLRVISPPIGSWRKLPGGYRVALAVVAMVVALMVIAGISDPSGEGVIYGLLNAAIWAGILLIIVAVAYDRVRRSVVFELTGDALTITRLTPWGPPSTQSWPRDRIGEIHVARGSGLLIIHVIGRDMVEVWLGPDRGATEQVAAALRDGLEGAVPGATPVRGIMTSEALPPGPGRTALLITAFVLAGAGVAVAVFVNIYLAIVPLALAGIPAGMALGTQKKTWYSRRIVDP